MKKIICDVCGGTLIMNENKSALICELCGNQPMSPLLSDDNEICGFDQIIIDNENFSINNVMAEDIAIGDDIGANANSNSNSNSNIEPLLKRVFIFLEDGDWTSADVYCEKVLDIEPENAQAYLGKLMAEYHIKTYGDFSDCQILFDNSNNYQKIIRFGDEELKKSLAGYIEEINVKIKLARLENDYSTAKIYMDSAKNEYDYKDAEKRFIALSDYKDSEKLAMLCASEAENARKDEILAIAELKMSQNVIPGYEAAITLLESIPGWRDADAKADACRKNISTIKEWEQEALAATEKRKKRKKRMIAIVTTVSCLLVAFVIILITFIIPNFRYNNAIDLMADGDYDAAISVFQELQGYKDSEEKITECIDGKYNDAVALMDSGRYQEAIDAFYEVYYSNNHLPYKDIGEKIAECENASATAIMDDKYDNAISLMNSGNYKEAIAAFEELYALNDWVWYKDSENKIEECEKEIRDIYFKNTKESLKTLKAGDTLNFGMYEQDYDLEGEEEIEWMVLEIKDGKALLLSKYALVSRDFHPGVADFTWETSEMRNWLNNDFINSAFSAEEKQIIPTMNVTAESNPSYRTNPGNATKDKVFLLSISEVEKYFQSNAFRVCEPTANVAEFEEYGYKRCWWWLRNPGKYEYYSSFVDEDGSIDIEGECIRVHNEDRYDEYYTYGAVRPALWINLN